MSNAPISGDATVLPNPMTATEHQARDLMHASNYRHLEYLIPDLRNATILLETMMDDTLSKPEKIHHLKRFDLTEDQWEALVYAIRHVGDLARGLSKTFYRGFDAALDHEARA